MRDEELDLDLLPHKSGLEVYTLGAALYVGMVKNGYLEEATEFAEWFLDTFDLDLET